MNPRIKSLLNCPHCGLDNLPTELRCRSCGKGLILYIGPAANLPRRFGVGSLMLLVLATAPGLAALRAAPGLGLMLLLILTPAAIRTTAIVAQYVEDQRPLTLASKIRILLGSIGVMVLTGSSAAFTFGLLSIPIGALTYNLGSYGLVFGGLIAGVFASIVGVYFIRKLWPHRDG